MGTPLQLNGIFELACSFPVKHQRCTNPPTRERPLGPWSWLSPVDSERPGARHPRPSLPENLNRMREDFILGPGEMSKVN